MFYNVLNLYLVYSLWWTGSTTGEQRQISFFSLFSFLPMIGLIENLKAQYKMKILSLNTKNNCRKPKGRFQLALHLINYYNLVISLPIPPFITSGNMLHKEPLLFAVAELLAPKCKTHKKKQNLIKN